VSPQKIGKSPISRGGYLPLARFPRILRKSRHFRRPPYLNALRKTDGRRAVWEVVRNYRVKGRNFLPGRAHRRCPRRADRRWGRSEPGRALSADADRRGPGGLRRSRPLGSHHHPAAGRAYTQTPLRLTAGRSTAVGGRPPPWSAHASPPPSSLRSDIPPTSRVLLARSARCAGFPRRLPSTTEVDTRPPAALLEQLQELVDDAIEILATSD